MNIERIYAYRFKNVNRNTKIATWKILAKFLYQKMGSPATMLDPAAGECEFINLVPAGERWAVDMSERTKKLVAQEVKLITGDSLTVDLPKNYFEGVFLSNFLEHLPNQEAVATFLERMYVVMKKGGVIAVMGPNFKYCAPVYFDAADHHTILTEVGLAEHLYGAGFEVETIYPRFLPFSFRTRLPVRGFLVTQYLRMPLAWRFMGKQFLLLARKVDDTL